MYDIDAPPFWLKNMRDKFPGFEGKVDRWQIIHFEAPGTIRIDVGVAKAGTGAPEGDRSQGVNGFVMNTITPETRTAHYFWAFMRNYRLESQLITTQLRDGVHGVFGEDEDMLTAQQRAIEANPEHEFYSLNVDAGGMWVRRILGDRHACRPSAGRPACSGRATGKRRDRRRKHTLAARPVVTTVPAADGIARIVVETELAKHAHNPAPHRRLVYHRRREHDAGPTRSPSPIAGGRRLTLSVFKCPDLAGRLRVHALAQPRATARDDAAAAELPAAGRRRALRADRRRRRHHRHHRDCRHPAARRRRLHADLRRS